MAYRCIQKLFAPTQKATPEGAAFLRFNLYFSNACFWLARALSEEFAGVYSPSRSERFQLIRSPRVVLLLEEEELLWSFASLCPLCSFSLPRSL